MQGDFYRNFPQLDGLRAIAVILVFLHHWSLPDSGLGIIGVQLFFVLSGFLITRILLELRNTSDTSGQTIRFSLRQFYARRFLRIFPLYYFCLILFVILDRFAIRETAIWHFFYLSNFRFFFLGAFEGPFSHFWTLAVEEQFYLIWPFVVLLAPRRRLPQILVLFIVLAPLTRAAFWATMGQHFASTSTLLPANLDTLGLGALGACWREASGSVPESVRRWSVWIVPACIIEIGLARWLGGAGIIFTILDSLAVAVVSLWFVLAGTNGFSGIFGTFLMNPVIQYLGRISYGLYVWHMFAPAFLRNLLKVAGLPETWNHGFIGFLLLFLGTVAVASVSWIILERPLNRLKCNFPYQSERVALTNTSR